MPNEIEMSMFEMLLAECANSDLSFEANLSENEKFEVKNMLEHCYILDENEIPHKYQLLEANAIVPGYKIKVNFIFFFNKTVYS